MSTRPTPCRSVQPSSHARSRRRAVALALVVGPLLLAPTGLAASPADRPVPAGPSSPTRSTLVVDLQGMRSDRGVLRLALFESPAGFPDEPARARRASIVPVRGRRARVVWSDIPPGRYAVAVLHDENRNGRLDKSWIGMPVEGSGFSRDAAGSWGPPDFEDAVLDVAAGRVVRTVVPVRYF